MKTTEKKNHPYRKLGRVLFLRGAGMTALAAVVVLGFRALSYGKLAGSVIDFISLALHVNLMDATRIYQHLIPNNMETIIGLTILVLMLLLFDMLLHSYMKYFDQVVTGVDRLADLAEEEIILDPELDFAAKKLNEVRRTLIRQEQEARKAEQEKNDLVVYLAHDIRTPLTSVLGYLGLLDEHTDLPEKQRCKYIHIAMEKAERLDMLVNEFFELTRYEFQEVPLNRESIDLRYMLEQLGDELYPQLTAAGKRFENLIPHGLCVSADGDKLVRVFVNLLKNAISYGDEGCRIRVSAEQPPGRVVLRFENDGSIPPNRLEAVFDKFCRLESARSGDTGGAGLGLAIARDIVRLHGGEIRAESAGGKTVFTVELPTDK